MGTATWEPCRGASPVGVDNRRLTASTVQNEKRWCVIDKMTEKEDTGNATVKKRLAYGKTRIIIKEHFSEQGKTIDELWTDVLLEKAKQTTAWEKGAEMKNILNEEKCPCYTLSASRYCKHGLVIEEDNWQWNNRFTILHFILGWAVMMNYRGKAPVSRHREVCSAPMPENTIWTLLTST